MKCSLAFCLVSLITVAAYSQIKYPPTPKVKQEDRFFDTTISDPYRWLENDTNEATKQWVNEQSKITNAYLGAIPYRHSIRHRIANHYNYSRYSSPFLNGGYLYYFKNEGLQNYPVLFRQKGVNGSPEEVIDPNELSLDGSVQLTSFVPSKNGRYGAWMFSNSGSDWQTIRVRDLQTMTDLQDSLKWIKESDIAWQDSGFYYSRYPEPSAGAELTTTNQNQQLWFHVVGTAQSEDRLVFQDTAHPFRFYYASSSDDERFIFLSVMDRAQKGATGNALWYLDNHSKNKTFKPIVAEPGQHVYGVVDPIGGKLLIQTNDNAPNSKVILFDPSMPDRRHWRTIIPEKKDALEMATLAGSRLFVTYLHEASSRIIVYHLNGRFSREIHLPGIGNAEVARGSSSDTTVFYSFRSLNYPAHIYQFNIKNGSSSVFRKPEIRFDPGDFVTTQKFFMSRDGTRISCFIVHKKGLKRNGKNPTLLYGYGGFGYSPGLTYDASIIPWLEEGGIYVIANLRGGGEYGDAWHRAGMLHNKQRVFDDFIAAAEYLVNRKYTSPAHLAIRGASNGGLLVGAVINQRPELFKVAVAEMGVMDMLRFQKFTIGWNWIAEYGSSENENDFRNLLSYSPLHNIKPNAEYPATLIVTADHDDRVVPAHSFKYTAALQESYKGKNPVLLKIETNAGHGLSGIVKNIELAADIFAFVSFNIGLNWIIEETVEEK